VVSPFSPMGVWNYSKAVLSPVCWDILPIYHLSRGFFSFAADREAYSKNDDTTRGLASHTFFGG